MALVVDSKKILLVKERIGQKDILILPGGAVEDNEKPEEAAVRELKEETGLSGRVIRPLNVLNRRNSTKEYVFLVHVEDKHKLVVGKDPELPMNEQIILDVQWYDFDRLSEKDKAYMWSYGLMDVDGFQL